MRRKKKIGVVLPDYLKPVENGVVANLGLGFRELEL